MIQNYFRVCNCFVLIILSFLLCFGITSADYTQLSWDLPFKDAQHTSLAPAKGPQSGASTKWHKSIPGFTTASMPFTVAGHVGHVFFTDGNGTIYALNSKKQGSLVWKQRISKPSRGSNDAVPIVLSSTESSRRIAVASCEEFSPHSCVVSVLDEDGKTLWATKSQTILNNQVEMNLEKYPDNSKIIDKQIHSDPSNKNHLGSHSLSDETNTEMNGLAENSPDNDPPFVETWQGKVRQIIPVHDGNVIIVPVCPVGSMILRNNCRIHAMNTQDGSILWTQQLAGHLRGEILATRSDRILVSMCDIASIQPKKPCISIFAAYHVTTGERIWQVSWEEEGISEASQFTGLIADNIFITLADDIKSQVWAVGVDMVNGKIIWKTKVQDALRSKNFLAAAGPTAPGNPRQLFIMTEGKLISLDTSGHLIWSNANVSNNVKAMAMDSHGAIYISTFRRYGQGTYSAAFDVYDARGGGWTYSIPVPQCLSQIPNHPNIPYFAIASERWILAMCNSQLIGIYSAAVPIWAWILMTVTFAFILFSVFIIGCWYHKKYTPSQPKVEYLT